MGENYKKIPQDTLQIMDRGSYITNDKREERPKYVFFWHEYDKNGYLSNWYESPFVIDDFKYRNVEQYVMAQKAKLFHDADGYTAILRASTPKECKALGKLVKPFDAELWDANKVRIMTEGNRAKFQQNPDLMEKLLDTGEALLAEASPYDGVWGIKLAAEDAALISPSEWPGQNLLGSILMELRLEFLGK
ncbi:NADAR family protein [Alloiococcus sp. CFN-8]|uniref:NADAR family protein n=1 Tax=Alloiococcus sp. CFN-8 TaxID=3416081 RepID=UPI003CF5BAA8